jgi:hypothetical protein
MTVTVLSPEGLHRAIKHQNTEWRTSHATPFFTWGELFANRTHKDFKYLTLKHIQNLYALDYRHQWMERPSYE